MNAAMLLKLAETGNANAMVSLAKAHLEGTGGAELDQQKAVVWLEKAAELGDQNAIQTLMALYS